MGKTIFLNGDFMAKEDGRLPVLSPGFLSGFGLFETMRSYKGRIVYLDWHLARLRSSARVIGMKVPYGSDRLKRAIDGTVKANLLTDARVRLTLWKRERGTDILITADRYNPYPRQKYDKGFNVCVSALRQEAGSFLARLKTTNRILYELSYAYAKKGGVDDAIILNDKGCIAEASRSNIFFVKSDELFTPSVGCGCLGGITRKAVLDLAGKYKVRAYEGEYTLTDLCACDEAFLTGSLMGIMPIASVAGVRIGTAKKITGLFTDKYASLLKDEG